MTRRPFLVPIASLTAAKWYLRELLDCRTLMVRERPAAFVEMWDRTDSDLRAARALPVAQWLVQHRREGWLIAAFSNRLPDTGWPTGRESRRFEHRRYRSAHSARAAREQRSCAKPV